MSAHQPQKYHGSMIKICEKHGDYEAKGMDFGSRIIYQGCPQCLIETQEDEKKSETKRLLNLKNTLLCGSGMPKRFLLKTLDDYIANTDQKNHALSISRKYAENFKTRQGEGCSLVFCGMPGTGKTHLACGIANHLINQYISVRYSSVYNAVMSVKTTYRKESEQTESQVLKSFINPALLILDEVGVQFGSDTEKLIMYQIINGRYDNVLPSILISNLSKEDLTKFIGERCIDRMKEGGGVVVAFDWESHRK